MSITSKRAVEVLSMATTFNGCGRCTSDELKEAVSAAIAALREKAEREDPKPLTIEELREDMVHAPIMAATGPDPDVIFHLCKGCGNYATDVCKDCVTDIRNPHPSRWEPKEE